MDNKDNNKDCNKNIKKITNRSKIQVRYSETDKMGVVYHANYFIYFETGRSKLLHNKNIFFSDIEKKEKVFFPVIEANAKFYSPAYYEDILEIETSIIYDYSPIFTMEYKVYRGDTLLCTGFTKHIFTSQETNKPVKPSKTFINLLYD